jgi:Sec-independent protein secretion pathway component TatC
VVSPLVVHYFLSFSSSSFPSAPQVPEWAGSLVNHTGGNIQATTAPAGGSLVQPWLELSQYISFTASLSLVFGLAFQTPLVVIFLVRMGLVDPKMLRRLRKHIFFAIVVIAAIISPSPDVMTMMAMALPMYALYEIGLLIGIRAKNRKAGAA